MAGTINVEKIASARKYMYEILTSYKEIKLEVEQTTDKLKEDWIGKGRNEFESQYRLLISKVSDIGDSLQEMYEAILNAEVSYTETDDEIRQKIVMSREG